MYDDIKELILAGSVPQLSIVFMAISAIITVAIFVGMLTFFKKKYGCSVKVFGIGCLVWLVFAQFIEGFAHTIILKQNFGLTIQQNLVLYSLYGGVMAGLFEEGGRFFAMKWLFDKERDNNHNALMYGAGHGGFEALYILGIVMFNNIIISLSINNGTVASTIASIEALPVVQQASNFNALLQMETLPPWYFLIGLVERIPALAAHIALSVLVWFAVKNAKPVLWFMAFGCHFALDALVALSTGLSNTFVTEAVCYVISILICILAVKVYKKYNSAETAEE